MLEIVPVSLKTANDFVARLHRHHRPVVGHKFSIGCADGGVLHGVAIVGRPVSRMLDDGYTLEVNRLCTDGTYNACSILYSACARATRDMGYRKIITYILASEPGTSLRASGWILEDDNCGGAAWSGRSKPKDPNQYPHEMKQRYVRIFAEDIGRNEWMFAEKDNKTPESQLSLLKQETAGEETKR